MEVGKKQQEIIELNEQIFSLKSKERRSSDRIYELETQLTELQKKIYEISRYGEIGKPKTTSYSQSENDEKKIQRELSVKIWNLE